MKACDFCGCKVNEKVASCPSCGSTRFKHVCPQCSSLFEGSYCNSCGIRFDAEGKDCPRCGKKYFGEYCNHCGFDSSREPDYQPQKRVVHDNKLHAGEGTMTVAALILAGFGLMTCATPLSLAALIIAISEEKKGRGSKFTTMAKIMGVFGTLESIAFLTMALVSSLK